MGQRMHGVIKPNKKGRNVPARVLNVQSKKRTKNRKIRLDKLIKSDRPIICIKRRLGGIGDVIMTTPLLKAFKKLLPNCHLIYATDLMYADGALGDIIRHNPYVDSLISNADVDDSKYDYCVDITATGLDKEKAGTIPPNRIDMFADEVGISIEADPVPIYIVSDGERDSAIKDIENKILKPTEKREDVKLIAIQARSNDARRTWPLKNIEELAVMLAKDPAIRVLLFDWGKSAERWKSSNGVITVIDQSLPHTAALVEQCDLVICPDSSMLHLAGALGKKIITIFGPIPPESRINHYSNAQAITLNLPCAPCVVGESKVLTELGYKEIQNIKEKDKVLTNSGKLEEVLAVHKKPTNERELFEINTFGSYKPIVLTEDHKLLISKRTLSWKKEDWFPGKRRGISKLSNPEWKEAKNIKVGDYCCLPIPQTIQPTNPLLQTKDLAWLVGLFVAEGWTRLPVKTSREYSTSLAISNKESEIEERVQEIITNNPHVFNSTHANKGFFKVEPNSKGESNIIKISNKNFVLLLSSLFRIDGKINLSNKYIPAELIHAPNEIIEAFLSGLLKGDGYQGTKDNVYSTAKENLAYGIQLLLVKLGKVSKVYKRTRDTNYKKNSVIYRIYASRGEEWKRWYKGKNHLLVPVKKIKKSNRKDCNVWDISVANDPTFTINNISAFDCWYSPRCVKTSNSKLDCLTKISPEMVHKAALKKLADNNTTETNIKYGVNMTKTGGQDPIILVKRVTGGMGDLIMATTGIEAIKKKFPNKKIHVAIQRKLFPVLENNPHIDAILDIDEPINSRRYYMVIDISYPCARYEIARLRSKKNVEKNRVEIFAEAMGTRELIPDLKPSFHITKEELTDGRDFIAQHNVDLTKKTIALATHSAEIYRDWPRKHYEEFIKLVSDKYNIVILHNERTEFYDNTIDACGLPLRKAVGIMAACDGLITIDTGLLHIAAAIDLPTIAIFGPIDYRARCKGYKNTTVLVSDLPCVPCWRNGVTKCKRTNLVKSYSECMNKISPKQVAKVIGIKFKTKDKQNVSST